MRHECRSPHVQTFRRSAVVGKFLTEHHLLLSQPIFSHKPLSVSAASPTGWNRRILLLFELFNFSAPFLKLLKCATARTSHAKVIVKNRHEYWSLIFSAKEVRWSFNRRPQRASWRIGASDPPLYSCKNLRIVWKRPYRRFLWFNPDFTAKTAVPPLQSRREHTFLRYKIQIKKSPLKNAKSVQKSRRPCSWGKHPDCVTTNRDRDTTYVGTSPCWLPWPL